MRGAPLTQRHTQQDDVISFLRKRDYKFVRELGQGACGRTVLLYDDQIDEHFVCKKYVPFSESQREILFSNFVRELKLLHQVHHANVVRRRVSIDLRHSQVEFTEFYSLGVC
jgi:eukaryotic-like serine/threonine-protein kinase